jgi:hypothetical protein
LVDDEDYADLAQFKWCAFRTPYTFYAMRRLSENGKVTSERLHRRIMKAKRGEDVDHQDHNGLNCQKENMRRCVRRLNNGNQQKTQRKTSSRYKGVYWYGRVNRWGACIGYEGKTIYLGSFEKDVDAALAYDKKAIELFGEFACLNFPERKAA